MGGSDAVSVPMVLWPGRPGKVAQVATRKGDVKSVELPSTVGGLAFLPKSFRLAMAH